MNKFISFIKEWKLPVAMLLGGVGGGILKCLPLSIQEQEVIGEMIPRIFQPVLIFTMLFLSFLKIAPREMRLHPWQLEVMGVQILFFLTASCVATQLQGGAKLLVEGVMLCFICPTATAAPVIVGKLGGNVAGNVTYVIMVNLMVSLVAPALFTWVVPHEGMTFFTSFCVIIRKVFPLLIFPLLLAWIVRFLLPSLHKNLLRYPDLAFYIWLVALALAILTTTIIIIDSKISWWYMLFFAIISLVCSLIQFAMGWLIGRRYGEVEKISATQSFGQKNTIFAIWMGIVFLDPLTSVAAGFYCLWHNLINAIQLHNKNVS